MITLNDFNFEDVYNDYLNSKTNHYEHLFMYIQDNRIIINSYAYYVKKNHRTKHFFYGKRQNYVIFFNIKNKRISITRISFSKKSKKRIQNITYNLYFKNEKLRLALSHLLKVNGVKYYDDSSIQNMILSTNFPNLYKKGISYTLVRYNSPYANKIARKNREDILKYLFGEKGKKARQYFDNIFTKNLKCNLSKVRYNVKLLNEKFPNIKEIVLSNYLPFEDIPDQYCKKVEKYYKYIYKNNICRIDLSSVYRLYRDSERIINSILAIDKDRIKKEHLSLYKEIVNRMHCIVKYKNIIELHNELANLNKKISALTSYAKFRLKTNKLKFKDYILEFPKDTDEIRDLGVIFKNCVYIYKHVMLNSNPSHLIFAIKKELDEVDEYYVCVEFYNGAFIQYLGYKNEQIEDPELLSLQKELALFLKKNLKKIKEVNIDHL